MQRILSAATVTAIGLTCKAYLNSGLCSVSVRGLPHLLDALHSTERRNGQGIVTVSNHLSTLDDPLTWGVLPVHTYLRSHLTRWTLGASDIMFTNPVFSAFFRRGQVIETFRGDGIYQPAVDDAIAKLCTGAWIHLFGEGKVCQSSTYKPDPQTGRSRLRRFKWGVGRILMETPRPPTIIPMWITGFDTLMPEGRAAPWKYSRAPVRASASRSARPFRPTRCSPRCGAMWARRRGLGRAAGARRWRGEAGGGRGGERTRQTRVALTELVQRAVETVGRSVSGTC
ncbi:acyltransferase-domain-containing protein [Gloeopeniophorella convolvens]|nr:acyltransferase-domain-containing protein [Gloeopeniophorella convolvens]